MVLVERFGEQSRFRPGGISEALISFDALIVVGSVQVLSFSQLKN